MKVSWSGCRFVAWWNLAFNKLKIMKRSKPVLIPPVRSPSRTVYVRLKFSRNSNFCEVKFPVIWNVFYISCSFFRFLPAVPYKLVYNLLGELNEDLK